MWRKWTRFWYRKRFDQSGLSGLHLHSGEKSVLRAEEARHVGRNAPSDLRLSSDNNLAFLVKKNKQRTGYLWSNIIDSVFQPEPWTTLFFPPYYKISFNKRSHYTYSTCGDVWRLRATFSILNSIGVWYFSPSRISSCLSECKHWSGSVGPDARDLDICCPQRLHHRHKVANGFWDWKEI